MAIRVSSSKQVDALISDLGSLDAVARAAAAARLIVIGARAVDRLLATAQSDAAAAVRIEAWRALDAIGDARTLEPALRALDDPIRPWRRRPWLRRGGSCAALTGPPPSIGSRRSCSIAGATSSCALRRCEPSTISVPRRRLRFADRWQPIRAIRYARSRAITAAARRGRRRAAWSAFARLERSRSEQDAPRRD